MIFWLFRDSLTNCYIWRTFKKFVKMSGNCEEISGKLREYCTEISEKIEEILVIFLLLSASLPVDHL